MQNLSGQLITVFGGGGFLGRYVVQRLLARGARVRIAQRDPRQAVFLKPLGGLGQTQFVAADVRDARSVARAATGSDAVVNLVGSFADMAAVQAAGAGHVAAAAKAAGAKALVHVSAIGADSESKSRYARSKAEGEAAALGLVPAAIVLRPSVVFGPEDSFFNRFASLARMMPVLPLIGGGETKFQPVYVGDVAEAVAQAVIRPDVAGQTYELGGPAVYSFKDLMRLILRETNRDRLLVPLPFFAARIIGSAAQMSALVGFAPLLTRDQVLMLETDNVVAPDAQGLDALGVQGTGLEAIAPSYLWRYRVGGQFAERPAL